MNLPFCGNRFPRIPARSQAGADSSRSRQGGRTRILVLLAVAVATAAALAQWPPGWAPPPPTLSGATLGDNIRNTVRSTSAAADAVRRSTRDWQNRVSYMGYQGSYYQQDYANLWFQFQNLRSQFNVLAALANQVGKAGASNAAAELDNGLNIISELFTYLQNQSAAGALDRATVARVCRAMDQALGEWQGELNRCSSRMNLIW